MKPITLTLLESLDACQDQVDLFATTYGESVTPTLSLCEEAAPIFNFYWLGQKCFGAAYLAAVKPHWEAYEAAVKPHWEAYRAAIKPHREAYQAARATHGEAYAAAVEPHWEAYRAAIAPHAQAQELAQARIFFTLWSSR